MFTNLPLKPLAIFVWLAATPFLMILSRNIATPVLVGVTALGVFLALKTNSISILLMLLRKTISDRSSITMIALLVLMVLSVFWSPVPLRGIEYVGHLFGNVLLFSVCASVLTLLPLADKKLHTVTLFLLLLAAAVLSVCELSLGSPVRAFLGGSTEAFRLNRAVVALILFLPLAAALLPRGLPGMGARMVLCISAAYAAFLSESSSAQLALIVIMIAWPIGFVFRRFAISVFAIGTIATLILFPFLAHHILDLIPERIQNHVGYGSLGIRADMWVAFSSLLTNAPFFGHGMEASLDAAAAYPDLALSEELLGWGHTHNFAIQVWYELGAVGVALFAILLFFYFRILRMVPQNLLPATLSTTAAVWTVSLVSHGAWQAWWWSLVGLLAMAWIMVLRADVAQRDPSSPSP